MSLLSHAAAGLAGYATSEIMKSHPITDKINSLYQRKNGRRTLRDVIAEFAKEQGVYYTSNDFAHELIKIAETYKAYDYDRIYG